jgi:DNA-directed RNA polymerase subunit RPC12/RpoP
MILCDFGYGGDFFASCEELAGAASGAVRPDLSGNAASTSSPAGKKWRLSCLAGRPSISVTVLVSSRHRGRAIIRRELRHHNAHLRLALDHLAASRRLRNSTVLGNGQRHADARVSSVHASWPRWRWICSPRLPWDTIVFRRDAPISMRMRPELKEAVEKAAANDRSRVDNGTAPPGFPKGQEVIRAEAYRCLKCGEIFADEYGALPHDSTPTNVGCPRCGEEEAIEGASVQVAICQLRQNGEPAAPRFCLHLRQNLFRVALLCM